MINFHLILNEDYYMLKNLKKQVLKRQLPDDSVAAGLTGS